MSADIVYGKWDKPNGPAETDCPWCTREYVPPTSAGASLPPLCLASAQSDVSAVADCTCTQWCGSDCTQEAPDPAALIGVYEAVSDERDDARDIALLMKRAISQLPFDLYEWLGVEREEMPDWLTGDDNGRDIWGGGDDD